MIIQLKTFIGYLFVFFALMLSSADAETKSLRFKDSQIEMPPGYLGESNITLPGLGSLKRQTSMSNDTAQLILARMVLLEKKLDLMEKRLGKLEGGKK